jgi:hypothetical protein
VSRRTWKRFQQRNVALPSSQWRSARARWGRSASSSVALHDRQHGYNPHSRKRRRSALGRSIGGRSQRRACAQINRSTDAKSSATPAPSPRCLPGCLDHLRFERPIERASHAASGVHASHRTRPCCGEHGRSLTGQAYRAGNAGGRWRSVASRQPAKRQPAHWLLFTRVFVIDARANVAGPAGTGRRESIVMLMIFGIALVLPSQSKLESGRALQKRGDGSSVQCRDHRVAVAIGRTSSRSFVLANPGHVPSGRVTIISDSNRFGSPSATATGRP